MNIEALPEMESREGMNMNEKFEINLNTIEILPPRYERRGDDRVSFLRSIERDRLGNVVKETELEAGTMMNFYFEPKPSLWDRFWALLS